MVKTADTLLVTMHKDDLVQGHVGDGLAKLLKKPVDVAQYDELEFYIQSGSVRILTAGEEIDQYKKIIMYGGVSRGLRYTHPLAYSLRAQNIDAYTSGAENFRGVDKLSQSVLFAHNEIPLPKTYFASPTNIIENAARHCGFPMIVKDILASRGERNFLVNTQAELEELLPAMNENRYIAQEYIENRGEVRLLINKDGDAYAFIKRATDGTHLNNTSAGAEVEEIADITDEMRNIGLKTIKAWQMPMLGLDLLERDGKYFVLEANIQPIIFAGADLAGKREFFKRTIT